MKFTFPDSQVEIDIDRVPYVAVEMITTSLQNSLPNKPKVPQREIKEDGVVIETVDLPTDIKLIQEAIDNPKTREQDKEIYRSDIERVKQYLDAKTKWDNELLAVRWQMIRLLYVKHLRSPIDETALQKSIDEAKEFGVDLRQQVRDLYAMHSVPLDEKYLDTWLYLWTVCVQSAADSGALSTWMTGGSKEALQAARQSALTLF